jgi:hypothetical protein
MLSFSIRTICLWRDYLDSLNKCTYEYIHTQVSWFRGKTTHSVLDEKNYMFLKAYALASIEPSLTHILNTPFSISHTYTFEILFDEKGLYMFSYKNLPFITGK